MRKIMLAFCGLMVMASAAFASLGKPYRWDSRVEDGNARDLEPTRGETMILEPRLLSYGTPMAVTGAATTVTMLYRAAGDTNVYQIPGIVGTGGIVRVVWTSSNELPARAYSYDVIVADQDGTVVGARGAIRFRDGPASGAVFATNEPIRVLDFATVLVLNPSLSPFVTSMATSGVIRIDSTADILSSGTGAGVQSLTLSTGRVDQIAKGVTAFGWGNHALAGYATGAVVRAADLAGYVETNDPRVVLALTNPAQFATAAQGARADLALTNAAAFDPAGSAAGVTLAGLGGVATSRTITINGTAGTLSSNLVFTVESGTANAVTNGGATINGQAISNGAAIVVAGGGGAVDSVIGYTGVVVLAASDVGALADGGTATSFSVADQITLPDGSFWQSGGLRDNNNSYTFDVNSKTLFKEDGEMMFNFSQTNISGIYFHPNIEVLYRNPANMTTNAGSAGAGYYAMSNGQWTVITPGSGTGGGLSGADATNITLGIIANAPSGFATTGTMTAVRHWYGTNAYTYYNGTGIVMVIP